MWVTQSYLATVEPDANVFVYYLFEDYSSEQKHLTQQVQRAMERMGDIHGSKVSLLIPNPRYADSIESEMRQIVPLWQLIHGTLPALLISTKPMKEINTDTEQCVYVPFIEKSPESIAETLKKARDLTYHALMQAELSHRNNQASLARRIGDSVELKPGIFGFRVDLKKLFAR